MCICSHNHVVSCLGSTWLSHSCHHFLGLACSLWHVLWLIGRGVLIYFWGSASQKKKKGFFGLWRYLDRWVEEVILDGFKGFLTSSFHIWDSFFFKWVVKFFCMPLYNLKKKKKRIKREKLNWHLSKPINNSTVSTPPWFSLWGENPFCPGLVAFSHMHSKYGLQKWSQFNTIQWHQLLCLLNLQVVLKFSKLTHTYINIMVEFRKRHCYFRIIMQCLLSHISSTTKYSDKIPKFPDKHITINSTEMGFETYW